MSPIIHILLKLEMRSLKINKNLASELFEKLVDKHFDGRPVRVGSLITFLAETAYLVGPA